MGRLENEMELLIALGLAGFGLYIFGTLTGGDDVTARFREEPDTADQMIAHNRAVLWSEDLATKIPKDIAAGIKIQELAERVILAYDSEELLEVLMEGCIALAKTPAPGKERITMILGLFSGVISSAKDARIPMESRTTQAIKIIQNRTKHWSKALAN